jgi:hypothetical protein
MSTTFWDRIVGNTNYSLVRRDSLAPGDEAVSSHYGRRFVKEVHVRGNQSQTTEIVWEGDPQKVGTDNEIYPSNTTIPLIQRGYRPSYGNNGTISASELSDGAIGIMAGELPQHLTVCKVAVYFKLNRTLYVRTIDEALLPTYLEHGWKLLNDRGVKS